MLELMHEALGHDPFLACFMVFLNFQHNEQYNEDRGEEGEITKLWYDKI